MMPEEKRQMFQYVFKSGWYKLHPSEFPCGMPSGYDANHDFLLKMYIEEGLNLKDIWVDMMAVDPDAGVVAVMGFGNKADV
jgi:hypothetical protein